MAYITDKLIPMWPPGWMKVHDIQSHFMPSKLKEKDTKKVTSETKISKPSSQSIAVVASLPSVGTDSIKDPTMTHHHEKKKSHITKDRETLKSTKHNISDKQTLPKTDKKHSLNTSERPMTTSLLSMPISDAFSAKSV